MDILNIAQVIVSVILIVLVLLQERAGGAGGLFGGGDDGGFYQTRRGLEKSIFAATIVLLALFAALSLINLVF